MSEAIEIIKLCLSFSYIIHCVLMFSILQNFVNFIYVTGNVLGPTEIGKCFHVIVNNEVVELHISIIFAMFDISRCFFVCLLTCLPSFDIIVCDSRFIHGLILAP